jgi:hypothetical protein
MQAKHGQIQIPLPTITDDARWIGRFSREVRRSIAALRDRNIVITGGQIRFSGGSSYTPWNPSFFTTGTYPSIVYKCRFNLGTVNNVVSTNWNDNFTLPSDNSLKFVVITVSSESGKITNVAISLDTASPTEDSIAKDIPPTEFKIVLGVVGKNYGKMIISTNLDMIASEIFKETKTAPAVGGEPFSRWWRWIQS